MQERRGRLAKESESHSRLSYLSGYWYINTREGVLLGPYDSKARALEGVISLKEELAEGGWKPMTDTA